MFIISKGGVNRKHNPLAVFLYPIGSYNIYGIVPPWKSVMEIQPFEVMNDGKGDAVFIALREKPPHPKWQCSIFHKSFIK